MIRSRKPHITSRIEAGRRLWFATGRGSRTSYAGLRPCAALRSLNAHRYHPIIEQGRFR